MSEQFPDPLLFRTAAPVSRRPLIIQIGPLGRLWPNVRAGDWGWMPALSLVSACGGLLMAIAHSLARYDSPFAQPLYWLALAVMFVPAAARLFMPGTTRQEAIALTIWLGLVVYLVKLLQSPLGFTFFDEFLHWRTANDILRTNHLFAENSLLPVSPLYPGLELATVALAQLTGLSIFGAGVVVVGMARVVLVLAIFLFFEGLGRSHRLASVATALYMCNSHFVIFDAQFAYESLALGFSLTVVWALLQRRDADQADRTGLNIVVILGLWSLIATHHATSYMTTIFLWLWAITTALFNRRFWGDQPGLIWAAVLSTAVNLIWLVCVSSITIGYLAPHLQGAVEAVVNLIAGEGSDRELFKSNNGLVTPLLEKLVGLGAPGLIMLCLPAGLLAFWQRQRRDAAALTLAIGSLSFPATMVLRLTGGGWEIASRAAVFVFVPLSYILALGMLWVVLPRPLARFQALLERARPWLFAPVVLVLFCGGIIAGWSPWARMPWPYRVGADTRSIEPQGLAAAHWAAANLGPNNRMAADRINMTLMGTYGEQRMITDLIDKVSISGIFLAPQIGPNERLALQKGNIRYVVVDMRISQGTPLDGHYYETWEKMIVSYTGPINRASLAKFEDMKQVSQVFDSGDLKIFDVSKLR
ncbi:MAG: hypothetical protein OHK0022_55850 [Roseiflexaceae bacterium]